MNPYEQLKKKFQEAMTRWGIAIRPRKDNRMMAYPQMIATELGIGDDRIRAVLSRYMDTCYMEGVLDTLHSIPMYKKTNDVPQAAEKQVTQVYDEGENDDGGQG